MKEFPLYHWSPSARRRQINRYGLRPGMRSVCGQWKPPYICFSASPSLAWALSIRFHPEIREWDLWYVWSDVPSGLEIIPFDYGEGPLAGEPKEFRVYERIYKRDIWYVATREMPAARRVRMTTRHRAA